MRFKGKVAGWFYAIIFLVAAVCVPLLIVSVCVEPNLFGTVVFLLVLISVESLCLSIVIRNYVEFQDEELLIAFGFIKKRIPYGEIAAVCVTTDPSASLAASLDRIRIQTRSKGNTMISIIDKTGFFKEMKNRNPDISIS